MDGSKQKNIHDIADLTKKQPCLLLLQDHWRMIQGACPLDSLCTRLVPQMDVGLHLQRFLKMDEKFNQIALSCSLSWSSHTFPLITHLEAHP